MTLPPDGGAVRPATPARGAAGADRPRRTGGSTKVPLSIFTFPSTHQAMAAEDVLRAEGVWLQVVPAPPHLVRGCGLAVRVRSPDAQRARAILAARRVLCHGPCGDRVD